MYSSRGRKPLLYPRWVEVMRVPRLQRILAVSHRDLKSELSHRQRGWILIAITGLLLIPVASAPTTLWMTSSTEVSVTGEVPAAVSDVQGITVVPDQADIGLFRDPEGAGLLVVGRPPPEALRAALDNNENKLEWVDVSPTRKAPHRSLLFALIAASVLTGAVSESISGERSRRTLQCLLSASITRLELILGKWLAWTGYGVLSVSAAALLSLLCGTTPWGWWLLPLPAVPAATVGLGIFMVRHATDPVTGATISLRIVPAVLAILGISAWFLGNIHPILGASVPIGGALIAAGQVWSGFAAPLIATTATLATTAGLLWVTSTQLEQRPDPYSPERTVREFFTEGLLTSGLWWIPLLGPVLWALAGNRQLADGLSLLGPVVAVSLSTGLAAAIWAAQENRPADTLGLRPKAIPWVGVLIGTWLLFNIGQNGLFPVPFASDETAWVHRLQLAIYPMQFNPLLGWSAIILQEIYFRGRLHQKLGAWPAILIFTLVTSPHDPVAGLCIGAALGSLTVVSNGSVIPAILCRVTAGILFTWTSSQTIPMSMAWSGVAAVAFVFWFLTATRRSSHAHSTGG